MTRRLAFALAAILPLAGCSSERAEFRLNTEGRDPAKISRVQAEAIVGTLEKLFGTPDVPAAPEGSGLDLAKLKMAAGPVGSDAAGNPWGLYRRWCTTCHGHTGDGAGPAASVLDPYPRDFRAGVFKYTSTAGGAKPIRDDLLRTLREGVPDTAMPSFGRLEQRELEALVEYVHYLSIRGQTESYLLGLVVDEDEPLPLNLGQVTDDGVRPVVESWAAARKLAVVPPPPPVDTPERLAASIERGRQLFANKDAKCVECHGPAGRGDGQQSELYDDWNKRKKGVTPEQTRELARWFRLPLQQLRPRDFTEGVFRGGSRPEDLYWRIDVGIKGTPMPAAGPAPGSAGIYKPAETWDVVNYVRSLYRRK